jgi:hypothetical protein
MFVFQNVLTLNSTCPERTVRTQGAINYYELAKVALPRASTMCYTLVELVYLLLFVSEGKLVPILVGTLPFLPAAARDF